MVKILGFLSLSAGCLLALISCDKVDKTLNPSPQSQTSFAITLPIPTRTPIIGGACFIDALNGTVTKSATIAKTKPLVIGGWAADDTAGTIPEPVIARLTSPDGSQVFYATTSDRVSRPDVAAHLKNPSLEKSGFNLTATLEAVPSGQYTLELLQPTATSLLLCADKGQVDIR